MLRPLLACWLLATSTAQAQNEVLPPVKTELKRDGSVLPYGQINSLLTKLRAHGEGLFRMDFKVDTEKSKMPLADVRLAVRSDDNDYPIKVDGEGRFDLPLLPEVEARTADFATNAAKGQMAVRGTLELTTPPEQLDMAKVRQVMRVARTLREELLPFYLRWLFPRIDAVRICSDTPTWELEWRENGQLMGLRLPPADTREPGTKKGEASRPCTLLTGQENWPQTARLLPPPGSKLSIKF
ncbi:MULTISPECIES: hypothetical protein [unclassified Roseateles]|uniref:hypothetical protein n=1 Tax=unclassified Roseateles TaxID=2626991 RepID=UPI0006F8F162|nr:MULTISPECIES: hypothetical protein [unclassified Roseateles]KQW52059.1 hypothetical protein ASC81_05540 [Pelomonas sp. Root405]KRA78293.1 hypothetical protein ASD88_05545 [Pelomonas sp. Root662]